MIYFKQILLVFLVVIFQKVASQPSINSIDSADFTVNLPEKPQYTGYSKLEYLKDSIKNKLVHDSLIKLYSRFDSLPNKLYPKEKFPFYKNIEFKKPETKPVFYTIFIFAILVLFVIKKTYFNENYQQETLAALRPFNFKNWIDELLTLFSFYNILSKLISALLLALTISIFLLRANVLISDNFSMQLYYMILIILGYVFIKYFLTTIFSYLFDMRDFSRLHFSINQINEHFIFLPVLILVSISFFSYGNFEIEIFIIIAAIMWAIAKIASLIQLSFWGFFKNREKKLYILMYLCTFEIFPVLLISRYVALAYL